MLLLIDILCQRILLIVIPPKSCMLQRIVIENMVILIIRV